MLGNTVTDRITRFTGVVIGIVDYISGCSQALVCPPVDKEGKLQESQWLDVQRLEVDAQTSAITLDNGASPGFDRAAPKR